VEPTAFYCVADERYFLGTAGLVNGLRLMGHGEPIRVLDLGLAEWQRDLLAPECELVPAPADIAPWLAKTVAPRERPAEVSVLIDTDMIPTRSLTELAERARGGEVVAFRNDRDRFRPDWGQQLDLGPIERRPYVSSGLVFLGGDRGREVLDLLDDRQRRVDIARGHFGSDDPEYPFTYPEQDVLNAILCMPTYADHVARLEHRLAATPPWRGLHMTDATRLRCAFRDGTEPYVLHHFARKPWLAAMRSSVYTRLLTRLLLGRDVAIRVPADRIPLRLRTGPAARAARFAVDWGIGPPSYLRRRAREITAARREEART
jgi:hypothetical protein